MKIYTYEGKNLEELTLQALKELNVKPTIFWIGPIVGTTCGPGVIATFCFGKEVTFVEGGE